MWIEEVLNNKKIVGVRVKDSTLWLQVDSGGWIEIEVVGDCCSESFIDAVVFERQPLLTGEMKEFYFPAQPTTQEVDGLTAVEFLATGGILRILHRNSSNGYYGNYLTAKERGEPDPDAVDASLWFRRFPVQENPGI